MPSNLDSQLGQVMDPESLHVIQTNHLHKVLPHVYQKFIRAPKTNRIGNYELILNFQVYRIKNTMLFQKIMPSNFLS